MSSPLRKNTTVDSLADVSDDEAELPQPAGELLAAVAEMQAKHDEFTYHANTKVTLLNLISECLDSTVLRQSVSLADALQQTKVTSDKLKNWAKDIKNLPSIRDFLIAEGATLKHKATSDDPTPQLILPLSPAAGTLCHTVRSIYDFTLEIDNWRSQFKSIPC